ncbi:MAG: hypothetical protein BGP24_06810 [Lysobacterales bacterium 69-70]|nr:thioesterase [Xanthomonadaceae bacterium]ODU35046.1 MAG: hypothetical protein ABS97_07785 [Xanthomonadaceae bacterium SCN 69-320]ODV20311.1 MAG: hypothetical protein ABT27_08510 [Xanthomonadaceae bacterium SCN 69-25]OJY95304.1 MAG: hypothetical protein BGP24_06810 [Xanthomonadales bacterium 69-70]
MNKPDWFLFPRRLARPSLRLLCFPYAGSGASLPVFRDWAKAMPDGVEVAVLELPGRGKRFGEPLIGSLLPLADRIAAEVSQMSAVPFVIFGHSIGALIGYEVVRSLIARRAALPELLIASGKRAPHAPHPQRLHDLPAPELIAALKDYNGTPDEVLRSPELMDLFLPILRADFSLAETYAHAHTASFGVPIHAMGGTGDSGVPEALLREWGRHTHGGFVSEMYPGDHFFIQGEARQQVLQRVLQLVRARLPGVERLREVSAA